MRTIAQPTVSVNLASHALRVANARLQQLREQTDLDGCQQRHVASKQIENTTSDFVAAGEVLLAQRRRTAGGGESKTKRAQGDGSFLVIPTVEGGDAPACDSAETIPNLPSITNNASLRMYPDLLLGMLRQEQVAIGRIWLLCRHLDGAGRGWLHVAFVREQLTRKDSLLRIIGQRRLRQILKAGAGIFWERDDDGRLWLYGVARVAAALGVGRLRNRPIALPIADLITSLAHTRAHCYAAFHSGRKVDEASDLANPISRATLAELSGVTGRTQRRYDTLAGVETRSSIAIGAPFDTTQHSETAWQYGNATFKLTDHRGHRGAAGTTYLAWQLPNQYRGCHPQLPTGRQRKLNQQLRLLATTDDDLVNLRARGNGLVMQPDSSVKRPEYARLFFSNGRTAIHTTTERVYLLDRTTKQMGVWITLA